jgi:hypothetical protein
MSHCSPGLTAAARAMGRIIGNAITVPVMAALLREALQCTGLL